MDRIIENQAFEMVRFVVYKLCSRRAAKHIEESRYNYETNGLLVTSYHVIMALMYVSYIYSVLIVAVLVIAAWAVCRKTTYRLRYVRRLASVRRYICVVSGEILGDGTIVTITPQSGSEPNPDEPVVNSDVEEHPVNPRLVPGVDPAGAPPPGKRLGFKRHSRPKRFTSTMVDGKPMPYCEDGNCQFCDGAWETDSDPFTQNPEKEYHPEFANPDGGFFWDTCSSSDSGDDWSRKNTPLHLPTAPIGGPPSLGSVVTCDDGSMGGPFGNLTAGQKSLFKLSKLAINVADFWRREDKDLLSTSAFVVNLVGCLDFDDVATARKFLECVKGFFNVREIDPQSSTTDWIREMFKGGTKAARKHLPLVIKKILALVASVSILPSLLSSSSGGLLNMVGHVMKKKTTTKLGVISDVMDTLVSMVGSGIDWICEERTPTHLSDILQQSKLLRQIQLEYRLTMNDTQRRDWMREYPRVHTQLKELYEECFSNEEYNLVNMIDRERELLTKAYVEVCDTKPVSCQQTLAINFCGDSSIGKSLITKNLADIVGFYYQGEPYDTHQKFIIGDTKHWDGAHNGVKVMYLDDLDADKLDGEARSDRGINGSLCSLLINLVNRMAFTPPMAQAQDKGKIHPNPHLLIISSNKNNEFGDIKYMRDPTAGARRLISVSARLKEEFRLLSEKGGVDPHLLTDDVYTNCPWEFDVRRYDVATSTEANRGLERMRFYPQNYLIDKVRLRVCPSDVENLSEEESKTLSLVPDDEGFHTYVKRTENIDFRTLREWIVAELDSYQSASTVIDTFEEKNLAANAAYNQRRSFSQRLASMRIDPQAGGDRGMLGLGFYERTNDISQWPQWAFDGVASSSGASVVRSSVQYAMLSPRQRFCRWVGIMFRLFVQFPVFLVLAALVGSAPSGIRANLRAFYATCFVNACVLACTTGGSQSRVRSFARTILNTYVTPFATKRLAGLPDGEQLSNDRRVALYRASAFSKHKRTAQVIAGGIFAGLSLYALKSAISYYRTLSEVSKMEFFTQADQEVDKTPPESSPAGVPPERSEPEFTGIVEGSPRTTNSALRARTDTTYKGTYKGNPKDLTQRVKAFQENPCMSYTDVLGGVQNNIVRLYIEAVDCSDLSKAKSIDGRVTNQFGLILGSTHTATGILLNNHAFNPDAIYYKVTVCWKKRQRVRPVIIPRDFIAFGSELPNTTFDGVTGALDVALIGVRDMGSVKDITGMFMQQPAFSPSDAMYVKRMMCSTLVGSHCHQETMDVLSGDNHGIKPVNYAIGNMPETTFLGACVEGVADGGTCGLPYIAGRAIFGIHQGATGPHVYAAPLTQPIITALWNSLQQKAIPGATDVHVVIGTPLLAEVETSTSPPIVTMSDEVKLHRDSAVRTVEHHSKYTLLGSSGNEGSSFYSSLRKNPYKLAVYNMLPATREVCREYNTPDPNIHLSQHKLLDKTSAPTRVEPFTLRIAYKNVLDNLVSTFTSLALNDGTITGLGPCDMIEACTGFDRTLAGPLELTTSAGTLPGKKREYFERVYDEQLEYHVTRLKADHPMTPYITDCVENMITRARRGITGTLSRKVVPKDEPRPATRDADGQIVRKIARLIHAGELVELIVFRMFFLPIMTVLGMDPGGFGHAVGLNPSEAWGELYKRLNTHSGVANFATDYSSFDMTISVDLLDAAVNLLIAMTHQMSGYTDEHRRIMRVICYDLCNPIYNIDGAWVRFTGSNSSGNPLTTMLNCLVNHLVWNQIWVMWSHDTQNPDQSGMYHLASDRMPPLSTVMSITCLGDDFLGAVTVACGFTQIHAVAYAAQLGFTLTGAEKDAEITPYAPTTSFLKREMVVYETANHGDLVLAPLAMSSLLRPFVWGEWNVDMVEHFAGLIKGMLIELVQHGPEVYGEYVSLFRVFVSDFRITYHTSDKRADIREPLASYFSDQDFKPWEDRITEIYGNGEPVHVFVDTARRV